MLHWAYTDTGATRAVPGGGLRGEVAPDRAGRGRGLEPMPATMPRGEGSGLLRFTFTFTGATLHMWQMVNYIVVKKIMFILPNI